MLNLPLEIDFHFGYLLAAALSLLLASAAFRIGKSTLVATLLAVIGLACVSMPALKNSGLLILVGGVSLLLITVMSAVISHFVAEPELHH
jgi:hypothetical protein